MPEVESTKFDKSHPYHRKPETERRPFFSCWELQSYYGESYVVQNISFDIREGEVLALLGRNGAGKTSTLRTIARTDSPSLKYGEIWLDHQPIHEMTSYQAAQKGIQLVPEDRRIIGGLSVEENLKLAQIEEPHGWSFERIYESFPRLAERRKQEAITLSGGEQQRLCIARTIAIQPEVILMDEPCSALDPISTLKIEETMHELKKSFTIVIVTHNMQQAVRVSDMTAFFNAEALQGGSGKVGYLVEFNDTDRIFNAPSQQATNDYVSGRFG